MLLPAEAMNYLVKKGLSPTQAAGIVGNLMQESGLNPTAVNKNDPGGSFGLPQYNGPRKQAYFDYAGDAAYDPYKQMDFMFEEFKGPEKRAYKKLMDATDLQSAVDAGLAFERPSDPQREKRIGYAQQALAGYAPERGPNRGLDQNSLWDRTMVADSQYKLPKKTWLQRLTGSIKSMASDTEKSPLQASFMGMTSLSGMPSEPAPAPDPMPFGRLAGNEEIEIEDYGIENEEDPIAKLMKILGM